MLKGIVSVACLLAFGAAAAWPQATSGEITGKLTDAAGRPLSDVEITAINPDTGVSRSALSEASGFYRIATLPPGDYELRASVSGFKTVVHRAVTVTVGEIARIDVMLEVGSATETVTVTGQTTVVNSEQGRVAELVDARKIRQLPLNGRNIYQLMQLAPGAVNSAATTFREGQNTSVNGVRPTNNGFWLDGVTTKGLSGGTNLQPSVDSVQEFSIETVNFSAEFGGASGSVVHVVSRSGSNTFHGGAYEFLRNERLDAREFFDGRRPRFKQNQFGATLGGPIRKNSTFFFGSYEGLRLRNGKTGVYTFESPEWVSFVQKYGQPVARFLYRNYAAPKLDRVTDYAGTYLFDQGYVVTPTQRNVDRFAELLYEAPPGSLSVTDPLLGESSVFVPDRTDANQMSGRVDHEFRGGKDKMFVRFYMDRTRGFAEVLPRAAFNSPQAIRSHQLALTETHVVSARWVNEFRAGLNRHTDDVSAGAPGVPEIVDGAASVTYFGAAHGFPFRFHENVFSVTDLFSVSRGDHGVKLGVELRRNHDNSESNAGRPSYEFYGLVYFGLDDPYFQAAGVDPHFLDGVRRGELATNNRGWRNSELGVFFNDSWKVRPNFTLSLGLRWDLFTRLGEVQGRATRFQLVSGENIFERLRRGEFVRASSLSAGDHNNFGPRLGLAWDPFGTGKTAVRGGFGVAFQSGIYQALASARWNPPFYSFNGLDDSTGRPREVILYGPASGRAVTATGANPNPGARLYEGNIIAYEPTNNNTTLLTAIVNPHIRDPYVMSWFLGIQRELARALLLEVNYVGTGGRKLIRAENFNRFTGDRVGRVSPTGEFAGDGSLNRVNPAYGDLLFVENSVNSSYHGMQLQLAKRMSHGYSVTGSYSLAKSLDVRSSWRAGSGTSNARQEGYSTDVLNIRLDHGRSIFDARHRFVLNFVWDMPFGKTSSRLASRTLAGWQFAGIVALQSGQPFTPYHGSSFYAGGDFNADGERNDRPNTPVIGNTVSSGRGSWSRPQSGPFDIPTANPWGIPTAVEKLAYFGKPILGTNGTLGRNTYEGPGYASVDLSLTRTFRISQKDEGLRLQVRSDLFNLFNRVNFKQPEPRINNPQFGRPTQTFDARQIQLGLKLVF
jgi:hypothetical protein